MATDALQGVSRTEGDSSDNRPVQKPSSAQNFLPDGNWTIFSDRGTKPYAYPHNDFSKNLIRVAREAVRGRVGEDAEFGTVWELGERVAGLGDGRWSVSGEVTFANLGSRFRRPYVVRLLVDGSSVSVQLVAISED